MISNGNKPFRILIVDDNEPIHTDFKRSLSGESDAATDLTAMEDAMFGTSTKAASSQRTTYRIDSALQGEQAFNMVRDAHAAGDRYALAFVDMRMPPGWDGLKTIEQCWSVDADVQVVICTAYSDYSWDEITARLGRTDRLLILRKPFDPVEVCQMAASLCEKYKLNGLAKIKQHELEELVQIRTAQLQEAMQQDRLRLDLLESLVEQRTTELRHAALHDKLTGLPNRSMICDRLVTAVERSEADPNYKFAVMFLDLDNFKLVNDTLGHEVGDKLLTDVARRISGSLRTQDSVDSARGLTAARLGGDEFVILLEDLKEHSDAEVVAGRVMYALSVPHELNGRQVRCGASIGITTNAASYTNVEQLLRDADIAMYQAKAEKNRYIVFTPDMHSRIVARVSLEDEIRRGLERDEFCLFYQPIVSLVSGELVGFESLLRWNHPQRGLVGPDQFIPLAESTGLIHEMGLWSIEATAKQIVAWNAKFPGRKIPINVNLSTRQLIEPTLLDGLRKILARTGVDSSQVIMEITEGFLAEELSVAEELLVALREMHIKTYIDDFGVGHSSLGRLPKLQIDGIKIDRMFLKEVSAKRKYAAIINAIINLAHHMDVSIVAEGIESVDQVALLQTLGCEKGQGYYFSRPVSVEQAEPYFTENWRLKHVLAA